MKSWQPFKENSCYSFVFAPFLTVQNYGPDTSDITVTLTFDLQNLIDSSISHSWPLYFKLEQILSRRSWNIYKLSINIWLQWPCPLTRDLQNLKRSSLSPSGPWYQILRNSLKAFPRYYVLKHGPDKRDVTVKLTFGLWPPKSHQFILESQWTFEVWRKSLKAFLRYRVHKNYG